MGKSQKRKPRFDMKREPGAFAVAEIDVTVFDEKRYNPAIMINSKWFKAPEELLSGQTQG